MKRTFLILLVAGCSALAAGTDPQSTEKELLLSESHIEADLGSFSDTEERQALIVLKNDTSQSCKIIKAVSNCNCTIPDLSTRVLAPGESMSVPVRVFLPFRRTETKLATEVAFETSLGPKLCTLTGTVSPSLRISRFHTEAARVGSNKTPAFPPILVESLLPAAISDISVQSDSGRLESRIETSGLPPTAFRVLVSASKDAQQDQGEIDDTLVLKFLHAGKPVAVPISAKLTGEARVLFDPPKINVGVISDAAPAKGVVQIRSARLEDQFVIEKVWTSSDSLQVSLKGLSPGRYELSYTLNARTQDATESAVRIPIYFTTNDPLANPARLILLGAIPKSAACCGATSHTKKDTNL